MDLDCRRHRTVTRKWLTQIHITTTLVHFHSTYIKRPLVTCLTSDGKRFGPCTVHPHTILFTYLQYFCSILSLMFSLLVDNNTVSSMNIRICNHSMNTYGLHFSLIGLINMLISITNKKQEVGDPCPTPWQVVNTAESIILSVLWYSYIGGQHHCPTPQTLHDSEQFFSWNDIISFREIYKYHKQFNFL